jgi:hypothetical protein
VICLNGDETDDEVASRLRDAWNVMKDRELSLVSEEKPVKLAKQLPPA